MAAVNNSILGERVVHPDLLSYKDISCQEMSLTQREDGFYYPDNRREYKFRAVPILSGPKGNKIQYLWRTTQKIGSIHVESLVNFLTQKKPSIHINTGTHGNKAGQNVNSIQNKHYAETDFLLQDMGIALRNENVSIHIVSKDSKETRPITANHIIDAWCLSEKNNFYTIHDAKKISIETMDVSLKYNIFNKCNYLSLCVLGGIRGLGVMPGRGNSYWVDAKKRDENTLGVSEWKFEKIQEGKYYIKIEPKGMGKELFLTYHIANNPLINDKRDSISNWLHVRPKDREVLELNPSKSIWKIRGLSNNEFRIVSNDNDMVLVVDKQKGYVYAVDNDEITDQISRWGIVPVKV